MSKKFPFQVTDSLVEKLNKGQTFIYDTLNGEYVLGVVGDEGKEKLYYGILSEFERLHGYSVPNTNNFVTRDNMLAELHANEIADNDIIMQKLNRGESIKYNIADKDYKISIDENKKINLSEPTNQPNEKTVIKLGTNHNFSQEKMKIQLKEALQKELISSQGSDKSMLQENTKELITTQAEIKGLEHAKASKKEINAAKQHEYELKQSIKSNAKKLAVKGEMTKSAYKDIKKANKTSIIEDVKAIKHKLFQKKDQNTKEGKTSKVQEKTPKPFTFNSML